VYPDDADDADDFNEWEEQWRTEDSAAAFTTRLSQDPARRNQVWIHEMSVNIIATDSHHQHL
jgi:hypothetical protein